MTDETIYTNNLFYFLNMLRDFRKAKSLIQVDMFAFLDDRLGRRILAELQKASFRGVQVEVVVDGYGSLESVRSLLGLCQSAGIQMKVYNPIPWPFSQFHSGEKMSPIKIFNLWNRLNRRNHKKLILIDDQIAYMGSHNFFDNTLSWKETSLSTRNPVVVRDLISVFHWTWVRSNTLGPKIFKRVPRPKFQATNIYFSSHYLFRRKFKKIISARIENAEKRIFISLPYFYPPTRIIRLLKKAAKKGLSVVILIPGKTDIWFFPRVTKRFYKSLLLDGVEIFEGQGPMIHGKKIIVDDWATIGSSNLNPRSLFRDLELNYAVTSNTSLDHLVSQFEIDKSLSTKVHLKDYLHFSVWKKIYILIARMFRHWI